MPGIADESRIDSPTLTWSKAAREFAGYWTTTTVEATGHALRMSADRAAAECRHCGAVLAKDDADEYNAKQNDLSPLGSFVVPCVHTRPEQHLAASLLIGVGWAVTNVYNDGVLRMNKDSYGTFVNKDGTVTRPQDNHSYILQSEMHTAGVKIRG